MTPSTAGAADAASEDAVVAAFERWFEAIDSGRSPSFDEAAQGDPAVAKALEGLLSRNGAVVDRLVAAPAPDAPSRPRPERLGDFRILSLIGEGAGGAVYLARQESLDRLAAVKVLGDGVAASPEARARFRREAELAAQISHHHVAPVYAVGEEGGRAYIAMKWLTGPPLDALATPVPPREVARIGAAVARALHEAHLAGIVHRDVKPANILLDAGSPTVVDFGLARAADDPRLTRGDVVPGTLLYVAPELLGGERRDADARSDVYSLGATLYELAVGAPPFVGESPSATVAKILGGRPRPPTEIGARDLEVVLLRALDRDPARRFPDAAAFADDLERFLRDEPVRSRRASALERAWRAARRRPRVAAAAALSLATALGAAGLVADERRRDALELERDLVAADRAWSEGRLDGARTLAEKHVDAPRARALLAALDAERRLAEGLDRLQDHVGVRTLAALAAHERAFEDLARGPVRTPRIARMAAATAAYFRGDRASAEAHAAAAESLPAPDGGPGYDVDVLRAVLDRRAPPPAPARFDRPSDAVTAAIVIQRSDRPDDEREAVLAAAAAAAPFDPRQKFASAWEPVRRGRPAEAEARLKACLDASTIRRLSTRSLAWVRLVLGDLDGADAALALARDGGADVHVELLAVELKRRRGDVDGARRDLERLLRGPGGADADVLLKAVDHAAAERRFDDAEAWVARAETAVQHPWERERCAVARLMLAAARAATSPGPDPAGLAALEAAAARLADEAKHDAHRARARWATAFARRAAGDSAAAYDALRDAIRLAPTDPAPQLSLACWRFDDAEDGRVADADAAYAEAIRAADAAAAEGRHSAVASEADVSLALRVGAFARMRAGDASGARAAVERWTARFAATADPAERDQVDRLRLELVDE
ncbi:MAG TPA: serine/threonine-protein kinase [Planctomycetota bacterium]|nr:serine/threonine-protein kinase [Planctomycetota bacterium]